MGKISETKFDGTGRSEQGADLRSTMKKGAKLDHTISLSGQQAQSNLRAQLSVNHPNVTAKATQTLK